MAVTVVVRARLKGDDPKAIQRIHDEVTAQTKAAALEAGDISHRAYLSPQDPRAFLGIDVWGSPEAFQKFASDPKIRGFFGQLFEGQPEVTVWTDSGWNAW